MNTMMITTEALSPNEAIQLTNLERVIERGKQTFVEVGNALAEIRDSRIYRSSHATFEDYCRERWGWSRFYSHRLIESAQVVDVLPMGNKPTSERQARPLAKLPPEKQPEAWEKAQEVAKEEGKPVTARHVEEAVKSVTQDQAPDEEEDPLPDYRPSQAMQFATMAIAQLERIDPKDTERKRAFEKVLRFCKRKS